jgi:hypothetical protein
METGMVQPVQRLYYEEPDQAASEDINSTVVTSAAAFGTLVV